MKNGRSVIVSGGGIGGDPGYPSAVQLADGSLLTVWYGLAVLCQARWSLQV
jgi:hypothetical protein